MGEYLEYFAEIITAAASSREGIVALVILIAGIIVHTRFPNHSKASVRLVALTIYLGVCVFFVYLIYTVEPIVAGDSIEGPLVATTEDAGVLEDEDAPELSRPTDRPGPPPTGYPEPVREGEEEAGEAYEGEEETGSLGQGEMQRIEPVRRRVDCGQAWTSWIDLGKGVGNPCPDDCERGAELGQKIRTVAMLRIQVRRKFQCWRHETAPRQLDPR